MSQHLQYRDGSSDAYSASTIHDSPAVGRTQQSSPRYAQDTQSPPTEPTSRYRRQAVPSPLQTSTSSDPYRSRTNSTTKGIYSSTISGSPRRMQETTRFTSPVGDEPRSPKERLDDLLASERSFYDSADNSAMSSASRSRTDPSSRPTNTSSRSASDPVVATKQNSRQTTNTPPMASVPEHRAAMARSNGIPRTSSIDSAISSISANTHSHKASTDSLVRGESPDIGNLIQAAGSSEAVIHHLLKEKASQAAQNTQLWRLVDKQRAMILGLNKDLERALKDKERYRKKMKDTVAVMAAGAEGATKSNTSQSFQQPRAQGVGAQIAAGIRDLDDEDTRPRQPSGNAESAPSPVTPPVGHSALDSKDSVGLPDTSSYALNNFSPDARKGFESRQKERKEAASKMANSFPARDLESRQSDISTVPGLPPSVNVTEASPKQHKISQPPRKAPPAPLNLNKQSEPSSHLRQANEGEDHDSDSDDDLEADEIPVSARGRRKTREEDDREREVAAMRDAESRSLSKKSKSKSAAAPIPDEPVPAIKQAVQISPPERNTTRLDPPESVAGSLAGILNSGTAPATNGSESRAETLKRTVLMPPPMSPGLPASPRPMQAMNSPFLRTTNMTLAPSNGGAPPLSARMGQFPGMPLSPRAPRQPIPLPPNTPMSGSMSMASPALQKAQLPQLQAPRPQQVSKLSEEAESPQLQRSPAGWTTGTEPGDIYRGYITDEYPELLLPPNALPLIDIKVASSRLKPSRASILFPNKMDEDPVFTLAVFSRSEGQELWRVEKDSLSLNWLDQDLKRHKTFADLKTPDKSLFSGHAPAKIDARRAALDKYLDEVLNTPMNTKSALLLCQYLSTNTIEPLVKVSRPQDAESPTKMGPDGKPLKHGYLTKRGKNFGGWKARYFVLDGPVLKYFESPPPGGAHLGAIKLQHSKIGKQQQQANDSKEEEDNQYRHAFLILEPKRKDSSSLVRHVLCAESDQERDEWVEALVQYMEVSDSDDAASLNSENLGRNDSSSSRTTATSSKKTKYGQKEQTIVEQDDDLRALPYDATVPGQAPRLVKRRPSDSATPSPSMNDHESQRSRENGTPSPPMTTHEERGPMLHSESGVSISGPQSMTKIEDSATWGQKPNVQPNVPEDKKNQKKRSFFGFGGNKHTPVSDSDHIEISNLSQMSFEQHGPIRAVFGAPLVEAVKYNHPADVDVALPAVVYRCVEYLEEKNAVSEEGIFRLSGSNVVIKALRERFNIEGDVNLITDGQYYDMHAVASLLKLYLRELPTTILTRELHLDFLAVTEIHDQHDKVAALCRLVHRLPKPNNTLLRYLSNFLINVITNCEVNKMTVRNVGIVFSPTLNIPAPVLALFLQQYDAIFEAEPIEEPEGKTSVEVTVTAPTLTPEEIRSPRRQQFQELPTPSYNQTSFPTGPSPSAQSPMGNNKAAYDTGFTPLQPSYENTYSQPNQEAFSSMNAAMSGAGPSYDQFPQPNGPVKQFGGSLSAMPGTTKSKRRESTMFGMSLGTKRPQEEKRKSSFSSLTRSVTDLSRSVTSESVEEDKTSTDVMQAWSTKNHFTNKGDKSPRTLKSLGRSFT